MEAKELNQLLARYVKGECNEQEKQFIHNWYDRIGQNIEQELVAEFEKEAAKQPLQETRLWSRIDPGAGKKKRTRDGHVLLRIAASILLLAMAGAGYFLFNTSGMKEQKALSGRDIKTGIDAFETRITNDKEVNREIMLNDGSSVTLKPHSEIRFANNFRQHTREVHLSGEAFFKVARDPSHPFLVYSNEVVTRVLGTSFTIKAYANEKEISVAVSSGRVSVYTNPDLQNAKMGAVRRQVILTSNQRVVYNRKNDHVSKQLVENPEIILSKPTLFEIDFKGVEVTRIFEVLEDNYGVEIVYDPEILKNCMLTTSMSDEGFYERIKIICMAINAEYEIKDTTVVITGPGCN